jgi:hypothetical protein
MVQIDLNCKKNLVFNTKSTEKLISANFIIQLPNNVIYTYPGKIDVSTNTVTVELPIMKDTIQKEVEGNSYLELQDQDERYYRFSKDTISFIFGAIVEVVFHSKDYTVDAQYKDVTEIILDSKNVKLTPVNYKSNEGQKPLRRETVLTMG